MMINFALVATTFLLPLQTKCLAFVPLSTTITTKNRLTSSSFHHHQQAHQALFSTLKEGPTTSTLEPAALIGDDSAYFSLEQQVRPLSNA
jgi:hypothetical protein